MNTSASASASPSAAARVSDHSAVTGDVVVQYVVLRRDLINFWPVGSVAAQACHASVAAIWAHRYKQDTVTYCSPANIDSVHKVTLEVRGETNMRGLAELLEEEGIEHKLWIEQPEHKL